MSEWILVMCIIMHDGFYSECYIVDTFSTDLSCNRVKEDGNDSTDWMYKFHCQEQEVEPWT